MIQTSFIELALWGKHDKVVRFNAAEYFNSNIPTSELEVIENAGHAPQLEVPDIVAEAIHLFISNQN